MTRPEMNRRLATIPAETLRLTHQAVLNGYGASGLVNEFNVNRKQANAVFEWVERYGRVIPDDFGGAA